MDGKDPSPFGCTCPSPPVPYARLTDKPNSADRFEPPNDHFAASPSGPNRQQLLSEDENNALTHFFSGDFFQFDSPAYDFTADGKTALDDFNWPSVTPANVHQVSASIPDQPQLYRNVHTEPFFGQDTFGAHQLPPTQQDDPQVLQAASALWQNNQAAHANGRSYSVPSAPSVQGFSMLSPNGACVNSNGINGLPVIPTSHGIMHDHTAMGPLPPHHNGSSPIDAQIATQFSQTQQPAPVYVQLDQPPPKLKRSYTYGTDRAFNPSGYAAPSPNIEKDVTQRMLQTLKYAAHEPVPPTPSMRGGMSSSGGEGPSEETSDEVDEEAKPNKRRKGKTAIKEENPPASRRKSSSAARPAKNRNASVDESSNKKKRGSLAGQKAQRENLTEEQKRNNHIMSEQKRRNLIKRGFDDLHDLVPEIRAGGLSKSHILLEAADFLEKVIADNQSYKELSKFPDG
jgi:hypothetical protein